LCKIRKTFKYLIYRKCLMNKKLIIFIVFFVIISSSFVLAVPPWKKQTATTATTTAAKPTATTPTTTIVQNKTTIIIQNNTSAPKEEGINWEFVGAITGILAIIAALIGWLLTRKNRSKASGYIKDINEAFNKYKNDTGKCEAELYRMKEQIEHDFAKGKISEESFTMLDTRIDKYLSDVRRGIVKTFELSSKDRKELNGMLEDGVISEDEYKKFSKMNLKELPKQERAKLEKLMKNWKKKK